MDTGRFLIDVVVSISVVNLAVDIVYCLLDRKNNKLKKELDELKAEYNRLKGVNNEQ